MESVSGDISFRFCFVVSHDEEDTGSKADNLKRRDPTARRLDITYDSPNLTSDQVGRKKENDGRNWNSHMDLSPPTAAIVSVPVRASRCGESRMSMSLFYTDRCSARRIFCVSCGFAITKADIFPATAAAGAGQVLLNITLPSLMFSKIVPAFTSENVGALGPSIIRLVIQLSLHN